MPKTNEKLFNEIIDCLEPLPKKLKTDPMYERGPEWTLGVTEVFKKVAKKNGFILAAQNLKPWGEWLFDFTFLDIGDTDREDYSMKSLPLVAECEWSKEMWEINMDYEKILIAKSKLKVMIFQDCHSRSFEEICGILLQRTKDYTDYGTGEKILLAGYENKKKKFDFSLIEITKPKLRLEYKFHYLALT